MLSLLSAAALGFYIAPTATIPPQRVDSRPFMSEANEQGGVTPAETLKNAIKQGRKFYTLKAQGGFFAGAEYYEELMQTAEDGISTIQSAMEAAADDTEARAFEDWLGKKEDLIATGEKLISTLEADCVEVLRTGQSKGFLK